MNILFKVVTIATIMILINLNEWAESSEPSEKEGNTSVRKDIEDMLNSLERKIEALEDKKSDELKSNVRRLDSVPSRARSNNLTPSYSVSNTKLSGRITKREGAIVKLNIGYDVGVKLGMVFSVYRIEKQVLLPLSGEQPLISSNELIGEIQITKVENNTSRGRILLEDNKYKIKSMCYVQEYEKPPIPNRPPIIKGLRSHLDQ